jgi:glycosyltransferase involved in cell wall biosynthesis
MTTEPRQKLSVVCPLRNEDASIEPFLARLVPVLEVIPGLDYEIVCVNDGSTDETLARLLQAQQRNPAIRVLDLSRGFGKEAALTAGIDAARGDAVIPIDVDLQDPPEVIIELVARWREGYEVVLAQRSDRSSDTWLKRFSAKMFYRLHNRIADEAIPEDVGDFRLLARPVVEALRNLPERRRFMKGLFAWVGFRTVTVEYVREPRQAGDSKFNGRRLWNLAVEGVTSFSTLPLRVWTYLGLFISLISLSYAAFILLRTLVNGIDLPGYASLLVSILFLGGVQLIGMGVLGEYVGRIYQEVKQRPIYIVRASYERGQPYTSAPIPPDLDSATPADH